MTFPELETLKAEETIKEGEDVTTPELDIVEPVVKNFCPSAVISPDADILDFPEINRVPLDDTVPLSTSKLAPSATVACIALIVAVELNELLADTTSELFAIMFPLDSKISEPTIYRLESAVNIPDACRLAPPSCVAAAVATAAAEKGFSLKL